MLIRLNVDQVRGGAVGLADIGLGQHGAGPTRGRADMGMGRDGAWPKPGWADCRQLSLENSKINQIKRAFTLFLH